jgi:hypothetical protein
MAYDNIVLTTNGFRGTEGSDYDEHINNNEVTDLLIDLAERREVEARKYRRMADCAETYGPERIAMALHKLKIVKDLKHDIDAGEAFEQGSEKVIYSYGQDCAKHLPSLHRRLEAASKDLNSMDWEIADVFGFNS